MNSQHLPLVALALLASTLAQAAPITYLGTVEVTGIRSSAGLLGSFSGVQTSDTLRFSYTFDPSLMGRSGPIDPTYAMWTAFSGMTLEINGVVQEAGGSPYLFEFRDNRPLCCSSDLRDSYSARPFGNQFGVPNAYLTLSEQRAMPQMMSSVLLPGSPPDIGWATYNRFEVFYCAPGLGCPDDISGYVTSLTVVPLPAAAWLFGSAVGSIALLRRRKLCA